MRAPAGRQVKLARSRVLPMGSKAAGEVDLLLRLPETDRDARNALHRAMKQGIDLALAYETAAEAPAVLVVEQPTAAAERSRTG